MNTKQAHLLKKNPLLEASAVRRECISKFKVLFKRSIKSFYPCLNCSINLLFMPSNKTYNIVISSNFSLLYNCFEDVFLSKFEQKTTILDNNILVHKYMKKYQ